MMVSAFGGLFIDNMLMVDDYFICSIGTVSYGGETKVVSVGIFNHVFTASADKLAEEAAEVHQSLPAAPELTGSIGFLNGVACSSAALAF